jgi:hypothetical protein
MAILIKHLYVFRDNESFRFMNIIKGYPLPIINPIDCLHCILLFFVKVLMYQFSVFDLKRIEQYHANFFIVLLVAWRANKRQQGRIWLN